MKAEEGSSRKTFKTMWNVSPNLRTRNKRNMIGRSVPTFTGRFLLKFPSASSLWPMSTLTASSNEFTSVSIFRRGSFLLAILVLLPVQSLAGGILHVFPPTLKGETFAVARPTVLRSSTHITVSESFLEYRIDQTFYNNNDFPVKAYYLFPLDGAESPQRAQVKIDGISNSFEMVSSSRVLTLLRDLTVRMRDPSLLGLAGKQMLVVRSVSLGAKQQRSFSVRYRIPFTGTADHLEIDCPLAGERYSVGPVADLIIRVRFKMSRTVRNVFSPSHNISVFRESPNRCVVTVRQQEERVSEDFQLLTTFSGRGLGLSLFTHRPKGGKGTFLAFIATPVFGSRGGEPEKDVVFLIDGSGSMDPANLQRSRRAVTFCLSRLRNRDRFNVLTIGTRTGKLAAKLLPVTKENVTKAVGMVNSIGETGATDLHNGLMSALEQFTSRRRRAVLMLVGDGRSTVGITNPRAILAAVKRYNDVGARVFVLALGEQPDMATLDKVAGATKGSVFHYSGKEDFRSVMNRFLARVSPPRVSQISLTFQGISPQNVFPSPIPDLFGRQSAIVLGRYEAKGAVRGVAELRAKVRGRFDVVKKTFSFPAVEERRPYLPRLWAMRRLSGLLEQEWFRGPEIAVRNRIGKLAEEFGFRVPTLVGKTPATEHPHTEGNELGILLWRLRRSNLASDLESPEIRIVDGKVFRLKGARWLDVRFRSSMPSTTVNFLGNDYFSLLQRDPGIGKFLAIGPQVTIVRGPTATIVRTGR